MTLLMRFVAWLGSIDWISVAQYVTTFVQISLILIAALMLSVIVIGIAALGRGRRRRKWARSARAAPDDGRFTRADNCATNERDRAGSQAKPGRQSAANAPTSNRGA
ncbi:hypothetical protein ACFFJ7_16580 [Pseudochelatococcus lubricantis]|uniref:hypothetical protein n=1 Tax=Pseudochelatococcus lubricantis TaxID=1538102 RepID=UPI0035E4B069